MSQTAPRSAHPGFGPDATSNEVAVLDSTIHWVEQGEGDPFVFLHGNPTSSFLWRKVFANLNGEGRLLAVDLIGFGDSGKPAIDYDLADHERYLDAWFDALDLRDVTLVLQDYGAAFGVSWARRNPDRVKAVALLEPVLWPIDSADLPEAFVQTRALVKRPGEGEEFVLEQNAFLTQLFPNVFLQPLPDDVLAEYLRPFPTPESRKPVIVFPRRLPVDNEPADTIALLEANAEWLASSEVPKLLLTFEPGFLLTPPILAWARETIKNLTVQEGGAGVHFVQEEEPEKVADAVKGWLPR
ncbi:haloalkane dehalogenase [Conexibacter stalactiti]|uniref:Haloalkane dehalogenase n=1 Tax=Conexibacter stalactiti TaxID=1940611 RepID=A0ABU4HKM0_9ACTN|nr:haloalkane dehalogenase [Conexibacter stalactiti]MDW5593848.1 haloalkane dehalogenase [Conexibacter stalactiti]MEC5034490.1 haloalkane dehalogenase [Conexibacter stalactiti]